MGKIGDSKLECRLLKNGHVGAIGTRIPREGVEGVTVTVGTPDHFFGSSTLTSPDYPPVTVPVDSENLGEKSTAGNVAAIGKQDMKKCWGKVGPSI